MRELDRLPGPLERKQMSHVGSIRCVVLLSIGLVAAAAAYGAEQPAGPDHSESDHSESDHGESGHGESGHSESGHSHLALFLGAGEEDVKGHRDTAEAVGIVYEYRFRSGWDAGAALERLEVGGHANTVAVIPAGYHFSNGLRLFAGPGHVFARGPAKDKWLFRAGISYEIHISEHWTIAPEIFNDFLEGGGDTWIAGLAIGHGF